MHSLHDMKRLDDGEDLNDALMDFFVKLGQSLIPASQCGQGRKLEEGRPSCGVAYLGSLFYDMLRKGGVSDGRAGHANVANWAKRRLGKGGLFADSIGALAVPVNETLRDKGKEEKHWWLGILLNPRGGRNCGGERSSLLCLDSFARAELRCDPPLRTLRDGNEHYSTEVSCLVRAGFTTRIRFKSSGDGSCGPVPDGRKSNLWVDGRRFKVRHADAYVDRPGDHGTPGLVAGTLEFYLDSEVKTGNQYSLEYAGDYQPMLRAQLRREVSEFQEQVGKFLGGYLSREWENAKVGATLGEEFEPESIVAGIQLPDVPQQERANDCGYFVLEQILRLLQLGPEALRALATASAEEVSSLPWPSQAQVAHRKGRLREALGALLSAARVAGSGDVDALLQSDADLRRRIQATLWDGPGFGNRVESFVEKRRPRFFQTELDTMGAKALRDLCVQYRVLPQGMVDKMDLVKALMPLATDAPKPKSRVAPTPEISQPRVPVSAPATVPSSSPPVPKAGTKTSPDLLAGSPFTRGDLDGVTSSRLRTLCIQKGCLPPGPVERSDLLDALAPFTRDELAAKRQRCV